MTDRVTAHDVTFGLIAVIGNREINNVVRNIDLMTMGFDPLLELCRGFNNRDFRCVQTGTQLVFCRTIRLCGRCSLGGSSWAHATIENLHHAGLGTRTELELFEESINLGHIH